MATQSLVKAETELAIVPAATPMGLLQTLVTQGASLETLERMVAFVERVQANEARDAYNHAFASFKAEAVRIVRNITVMDGPLKGKKYADLFAVVDSITPALSKHGLSHSWKLTKDDPAWLEVTCTLRHEAGHSESAAMGAAPDTGGAKNAIQARASAKSYLERYTLLGITGMASSGQDDDGNGTRVEPDKVKEWVEWLDNCRNLTELDKQFASAYKEAAAVKDQAAQTTLIAAKARRRKELAA